MANRSQAQFINQMLRLRSRIQNRLPHELLEQAGQIETHMAKQPKLYDERFTNHINSPFNQVPLTYVLVVSMYGPGREDFIEFLRSRFYLSCMTLYRWKIDNSKKEIPNMSRLFSLRCQYSVTNFSLKKSSCYTVAKVQTVFRYGYYRIYRFIHDYIPLNTFRNVHN